jgi:hypothetical protein
MHARTIVTRGVSTGLRLGRGTADRVVTVAGPHVARLTDKVASKVRRPGPPATTTFTPSKKAQEQVAAEPLEDPASAVPSPARVARNIGPPRPAAKPARSAKPKAVPGAKLPPPRPTAS